MIKIAKTEYGLVRGIPASDPRVISYKGIPFAAPPVGDLRWRAPQPAESWDGIKDCLEFAPISMQPIPGLDTNNIYTREWNVDPEIPMSEDCLYLNIWTPAVSTEDKLPVYVWYFGGGLQVGHTAEMEFDGERLARRGIVVVTVNYRVNVFGFLAHPELSSRYPEAPTNFGNLDQQFGLQWTKRNIAAFGGDPNQITIGGQSAGGGSVMTQLNCPDNKDYIQGAIVESGVFYNPNRNPFVSTLADAEQKGVEFFKGLGVSSLDDARKLPAELIRDYTEKNGWFWGTVVDGIFQKDSYWNNMIKGELLDVPMMLGYTNNEFYGFLENPSDPLTQEGYDTFWKNMKSLSVNPVKEEAGPSCEKINTVEMAIRMLCKRGEELGVQSPRYIYEFGPEIPGWDNPGAFHSSDLWFFFETLAKCWRPFTGKHYDLARFMCNYWAEFIKKGNPDGKDGDGTEMPHWEAFTTEKSPVMMFYEKAELKEKPAAEGMQKLLERNQIGAV